MAGRAHRPRAVRITRLRRTVRGDKEHSCTGQAASYGRGQQMGFLPCCKAVRTRAELGREVL